MTAILFNSTIAIITISNPTVVNYAFGTRHAADFFGLLTGMALALSDS